MEPVVYEKTPLADYLRDGGDGSEQDWVHADGSPEPPSPSSSASQPSSLPPSPSPFAPIGRPLVRARFRGRRPCASQPRESRLAITTLRAFRRKFSAAVAAGIDGADNAKFLEQFRYTIIASQLLSGHSVLSHQPAVASNPTVPATEHRHGSLFSSPAVVAPILCALAFAIILGCVRGRAPLQLSRKSMTFLLLMLAASAFLGHVYMKRSLLRYRREQAQSEMTAFVAISRDFDSVTEATVSLVQEVELVSHGYRIAPLPPISRLEDRSQNRKCVRLRKALKNSLGDLLTRYNDASRVVKGCCERTELEKYHDMYDVSDFDISDALQGFSNAEFDDPESLRTLKALAARFHTTRKMLLCALLALDANGEGADLLRWTTAVEALRGANISTRASYDRLRAILSEEESFPLPPTPKLPQTPGRERW